MNFQAYHVGWIISGVLALISTVVSFWLISKHLQWYTNKREQRYIVRLLFLVPLYAIVSFASFLFWNQSTPIILVRDAYEAIVLTAFFYLLLMYLSHDPEEQRRIFLKKGLSREAGALARQKGGKIPNWVWPMGFVKWKPKDGLYFLQLMKWGVLQYCVIRPTSTLAAVILDYVGLYCESSWGFGWGHVYIILLISISVTIAMYCLIQLYVPVSKELAPHKPLLKLFSVKAVVFLTFWQATGLSVLSMFGVVKGTKHMTAEDINIGIGAILETFEMMLFAFLHIRAFTYKPYMENPSKSGPPPSKTPQWRSLGHAMDFRETFREIWEGCVYMYEKMRGKEPTPDFGAKRAAHYESAFGRTRPGPGMPLTKAEKEDKTNAKLNDVTFPAVEIEVDQEVEVDIEGQQQWLGLGKNDRYGLNSRRERSEGLQEQIDHELERLGYPTLGPGRINLKADIDLPPAGRRQRSWWRSIYDRISQSGPPEEGREFVPSKRRSSKLHSNRQFHPDARHLPTDIDPNIDDLPPRSILHPFKIHSTGSSAAYNDYEQDRLFAEGERLIIKDNHEQRTSHYRDQWPIVPASPPPRSAQRTSRSAGMGLGTPPPNLQSFTESPAFYGRTLYMYNPGFRHQDEPRLMDATPQVFKDSPRSSRVPPREALDFPTLLHPRHNPSSPSRDVSQNAGLVSPAPRTDILQALAEEERTAIPHRKSVHRREAAHEIDDTDQLSWSAVPLAGHRSGLPSSIYPDDRTYMPQAIYNKPPTDRNIPHTGFP
ncbi:hypothetical protein NLJ89_g614 [Agrocybe chaxingu]|uniref:DUF300-domain-containing protein n=1 Tax=Agrocybe chaxingu TaxID=84603 RepID=A0A9W8N1N5_9AGAR|nr:hypothetical protein NLJ89_g614 [Agrocybe chaxingu]